MKSYLKHYYRTRKPGVLARIRYATKVLNAVSQFILAGVTVLAAGMAALAACNLV